jgi:uncharacterized protein YdeI (YjbR/CyaY-like superfamily)
MRSAGKSKRPSRQVTPASRAAWRAWLERNHAGCAEVWVVFYKRHTNKPTLSYDDAVEEALCFGWIDGVRRSLDAERYMHRFSPRKENSFWSPSNRARVERLLKAGLMTEAGQRLVDAAKQRGRWLAEKNRPTRPTGIPTELAKRLGRNAKARAFFDSLAPSYRRHFVSWVGLAKRAETRERRAEEAAALLAAGKKLGLK